MEIKQRAIVKNALADIFAKLLPIAKAMDKDVPLATVIRLYVDDLHEAQSKLAGVQMLLSPLDEGEKCGR